MPIRIDNSTVSDRVWGDVDKATLARRLQESGSEAAIREAFAYVPDLENRSEWGGPHYELQGDTLVLNRNGVHALAAVLPGLRLSHHLSGESEVRLLTAADRDGWRRSRLLPLSHHLGLVCHLSCSFLPCTFHRPGAGTPGSTRLRV